MLGVCAKRMPRRSMWTGRPPPASRLAKGCREVEAVGDEMNRRPEPTTRGPSKPTSGPKKPSSPGGPKSEQGVVPPSELVQKALADSGLDEGLRADVAGQDATDRQYRMGLGQRLDGPRDESYRVPEADGPIGASQRQEQQPSGASQAQRDQLFEDLRFRVQAQWASGRSDAPGHSQAQREQSSRPSPLYHAPEPYPWWRSGWALLAVLGGILLLAVLVVAL